MMMMKYNVTKLPNVEKLWGLTYRPTLEPTYSDDVDSIAEFMSTKSVPQEYSQRDRAVLREAVSSLGRRCRCILEIGSARSRDDNTATAVLTSAKPADCLYLGVDIEDRSFLAQPDRDVYTLQADSRDADLVKATLKELGHNRISLLHLDGWHSVRMALSDWHHYAQLVMLGGVVVMHDTSVHPGPAALYDAIDEALFDKRKFFADLVDDWGMAVCRRRDGKRPPQVKAS